MVYRIANIGTGTLPETATVPPGTVLIIGEETAATMPVFTLTCRPIPPPDHPHPHRGKRRRRWT